MRTLSTIIVTSALTAAALAAGCSSSSPSPSGSLGADGGYASSSSTTAHDPCVGEGWRQPTPGSVVCPGASQCECTGGTVCCLQAVDSSKGTCGSAGACRFLELTCDGPEDCAPSSSFVPFDGTADAGADSAAAPDASGPPALDSGAPAPDAAAPTPRVCCLDEAVGVGGGGSSCRAASQCAGRILCRTDDDCRYTQGLSHCRPADYGTPGVEDRGLDGLIGVCSR